MQITAYTFPAGKTIETEYEVKLQKRDAGGWDVVLASTGQKLGWMVKDGKLWTGYTANSAYYPADADVMVTIERHPDHLAHSSVQGEKQMYKGMTREDAASEIVNTLARRKAAALQA